MGAGQGAEGGWRQAAKALRVSAGLRARTCQRLWVGPGGLTEDPELGGSGGVSRPAPSPSPRPSISRARCHLRDPSSSLHRPLLAGAPLPLTVVGRQGAHSVRGGLSQGRRERTAGAEMRSTRKVLAKVEDKTVIKTPRRP